MAKCPRKINDDLYRDEWTWQEGEYTVYRNSQWTAPGCHNGCGVLHYVKDGKLVKIEGDPKSPQFNGRLCMRCLAMEEVVNHPTRIYTPMKRAKEDRGKDAWEKISWDEAYDIIEENYRKIVEQYGTKGIAVLTGTGRNTSWQNGALANGSFQSPNYAFGFLSGQSCAVPRHSTCFFMTGDMQVIDCAQCLPEGYDDPRFRPPEVIVVWGCNPIVSNADGFVGHWIVDEMKMGSKIIMIDPRFTWMAAQAEIWLRPRPGTDGALALGMISVIIDEDLWDHDFVDRWCYGFEELADRVHERTLEEYAEICDIPVEDIRKVARRYATAKPAAIHWGLKLDQFKYGLGASQALISLWGITGNVDVPGGNIIVNTGFISGDARRMFANACDTSERLGNETFPIQEKGLEPQASSDILLQAMETGEPYPVKMIFEQSSNFIANMGCDPKRLLAAARKMDFFVVSDYYMTPTAMACADVFLPVAMSIERVGIMSRYNPMRTLNKIVETNAKSDEQILLDLGHRLNPEHVPWKDPEEFWNGVMHNITGKAENGYFPDDLSYKKLQEQMYFWEPFEYRKYEKGMLRKDGQPGFNTHTGRFELYSNTLAFVEADPLPYYKEYEINPVDMPEYCAEYPIHLITGRRSWEFFHSEHRQLKTMREFHRWPIVEMTQETADKYGIEEGDWVLIENDRGSCREKCVINPCMYPDTIMAEHGWWFPERADEAEGDNPYGVFDVNINQLLPMMDYGPTGYGAPYDTQRCKISRCDDYHPVYNPQY